MYTLPNKDFPSFLPSIADVKAQLCQLPAIYTFSCYTTEQLKIVVIIYVTVVRQKTKLTMGTTRILVNIIKNNFLWLTSCTVHLMKCRKLYITIRFFSQQHADNTYSLQCQSHDRLALGRSRCRPLALTHKCGPLQLRCGPAQIVDPPFSVGLNVGRSNVITLQMWAV